MIRGEILRFAQIDNRSVHQAVSITPMRWQSWKT